MTALQDKIEEYRSTVKGTDFHAGFEVVATEAAWCEHEPAKLADEVLALRVRVRLVTGENNKLSADLARTQSKLDETKQAIAALEAERAASKAVVKP